MKVNSKTYHRTEISIEQLDLIKKDITQFKMVYNIYFDDIFKFLFRRSDDENLAGELASNTFLKAMESIKKYENRGVPFSSWLYKIASNELNKYYQKSKKNFVYSIEESRVFEVVPEDLSGDSEGLLRSLVIYLDELKEEELSILELRFFEGLEFAQIAFVLDKKESAVKMRLYRSLEKLRRRFEKDLQQ